MRYPRHNTINFSGYLMDLNIPKVMGILNVTPDSFFHESRSFDEKQIIERVKKLLEEGVDIIDVGGCSTRPGFLPPSEEEELKRLDQGCRIVRELAPEIPLSVDTFRASVAERVISSWNIHIINDISGGEDPEMWRIVADQKVTYVLTHNVEASHPDRNITAEVIIDLSKKVNELHRLGVNDIILDPGFGFAKTLEENFRLLNQLEEIVYMGYPVLVGISRKSMIHKTLNVTPDDSLIGTVALDAIALEKGANILRVHDVKPAKETVKLFTKLKDI